MRNRLGVFLFLTILLAAILGGLLGDRVSAGAPLEKDTQQLLKIFTEALITVQTHYIAPGSATELVESAIRGMLRSLDPHSSFFAVSDYNRLQEEQQGKYYGLGITIRAEAPGSGRVVIVEPPAPGTPAYKVGLRFGDVISKIEGTPIEDWDLNKQVIPNLKGPKGTKVTITIERPGKTESIDVTVERDEITLYTIKFALHIRPRLGYVKISRFSETTTRELNESLEKLDESHLEGLILDLRDNPGGALNQAISVADRFLKKGDLIVSTRSRQGRPHEYRAPKGSRYRYPMVILINRNSASASEIVSGALQDHDRALIVGETSFGKALVQTIYPLEGDRGLALTTGKYYTPSDRLIQRDYSHGLFDYFYNREDRDENKGMQHRTASGRPVFAGGGITPDEKVDLKDNSRLARVTDRRDLFYEFSEQLAQGKIVTDIRYHYSQEERDAWTPQARQELMQEVIVSDETLLRLQEFLHQKKINLTKERFEEDRESIRTTLKENLFLLLFGEQEAFRVILERDQQVLRAIELIPRAHNLVEKHIAHRR